MSSDSEDDLYTNSASVLKAIKKKKYCDTEIKDDINDSFLNEIDGQTITKKPDLITKRNLRVTNKEKKNKTTTNVEIGEQSSNEIIDISNVDNSCVVISDDSAETTPIDIVSTIDNYLGQPKSRGRRKSNRWTKRKPNKINPRFIKQKILPKSPNRTFVHDLTLNDTDCDDVNYEVTLKVWWQSQYVEKLTLRRFEKMLTIYKHFASKENVPEDRLLFTIRERIISKDDTPNSLNINAATIIEGGILSEKSNVNASKHTSEEEIELKVQLKDRKKPLLINLKPTDTMDVLMVQCVEELGVSVKQLKFYFDGDSIKATDTPNSLQLEGGECIDCVQK